MRASRFSLAAAGWLALALLLVPFAWAVWVSFSPDELLRPPVGVWSLRWYRRFFAEDRWVRACFNSLRVGLGSAALSVVLGAPVALAVARRRFAGRVAVSRFILLPLCVPPLVLGVGLLPVMHGLGLWGSVLSLILAHALLGVPMVYLCVRAALEAAPPELEDAARGLGAGPVRALWRVTLPLCRPGLLAGAALSFVLSLNDFFLGLFLATPRTQTLPGVIWPELRYSLSPLVAVASMIALTATLAGSLLVPVVWRALRGAEKAEE